MKCEMSQLSIVILIVIAIKFLWILACVIKTENRPLAK